MAEGTPSPQTKHPQLPELRVGLVGVSGWFFQRAHLPAWQRLETRRDLPFRIRVVAAHVREASLEKARKRLGPWGAQIRWFTDFDELLAHGPVDLLDISLPIPAQLELIERALAAGKSVVSEKPICAWPSDAVPVLRRLALAEPPRAWSVLENWAFKPGVRRVLELLEGGAIGTPSSYSLRVVRRAPPPRNVGWRTPGAYEGFALLDVGVHLIRAARLWFGEVCDVSGCRLAADGAEGTGSLRHSRGAWAVLGELRWQLAAAGGEELALATVSGSGGSLEWDMDAATVAVRPAHAAAPAVANVQGDGWVAGGVREALLDAAVHTAHVCGLVARGPEVHHTCAREALSDALAVSALCESARQQAGGRAAPVPVQRPPCLLGVAVPTADACASWVDVPTHAAVCSTEDDVECALALCLGLRAEPGGALLRVAARGSGHSWAPRGRALEAEGEQPSGRAPGPSLEVRLSVRPLCFVHVLPGPAPAPPGSARPAALVRVGAGTPLRVLVRTLLAHGLGLPCLPMQLGMSAGGAVSTGSHGSSLRHGCLGDALADVRLCAPGAAGPGSGTPRCFWLSERPDLPPGALAAARTSCGALGVVTELRLRACEGYCVRACSQSLPFGGSAAQTAELVRLVRAHEHGWAHWRLGEARALVSLLERLPPGQPGAAPYDGLNWFLPPCSLPADCEPGALAEGQLAQEAGGQREAACPQQGPAAVWVSSEWALPLARAHEAVEALQRSLGVSHRGRLIELKFAAASRHASLLGCNGGGADACCFNVWWRSSSRPARAVLRPFEAAMREVGATPHWGKVHSMPAHYAEQVLGERLAAFRKVALALDPSRMFAPAWC